MLIFIWKNLLLSFVGVYYFISWNFLYPCYQMILQEEEGTITFLTLATRISSKVFVPGRTDSQKLQRFAAWKKSPLKI